MQKVRSADIRLIRHLDVQAILFRRYLLAYFAFCSTKKGFYHENQKRIITHLIGRFVNNLIGGLHPVLRINNNTKILPATCEEFNIKFNDLH